MLNKTPTLDRLKAEGYEYVGFRNKPWVELYRNNTTNLFYDPATDSVVEGSIEDITKEIPKILSEVRNNGIA